MQRRVNLERAIQLTEVARTQGDIQRGQGNTPEELAPSVALPTVIHTASAPCSPPEVPMGDAQGTSILSFVVSS